MDCLAVLEMVRDDEGRVLGMFAVDAATIKEDRGHYIQWIDGKPVASWGKDELVVIPMPASLKR